MPSISEFKDIAAVQIGTFELGKWDYVMLAQLFPSLEALAQLVPRKRPMSNYELTVTYQDRTTNTTESTTPGTPITIGEQSSLFTRKLSPVYARDTLSWQTQADVLQGKSNEHIVRKIQSDLVQFDLHFWEWLEQQLLRAPSSLTHADSNPIWGFRSWITADANISDDSFEIHGGDDPYNGGRPGSISVSDYAGFTNPVGKFSSVSDTSLFKLLDEFLTKRKTNGAVPNPRLLPDTPNDVAYVQFPLHNAIKNYLTASNGLVGMDAGRYRGQPLYDGIPFVVWHALDSADSPVQSTDCELFLIDWNSFDYRVVPEYDRKISPPTDVNLVPGSVYITSEIYHQLGCLRPDRNFYATSDNTAYAP